MTGHGVVEPCGWRKVADKGGILGHRGVYLHSNQREREGAVEGGSERGGLLAFIPAV